MPFIENCSASDVEQGLHTDPGSNNLLIQIGSPASWFPRPTYAFKQSYQFEFLDAEDDDDFPEESKFSDRQADRIVEILTQALVDNTNIIIHCHAGVYRSGAIVEVAVMMGFSDCKKRRCANLRVKHKLLESLNWRYDSYELPYMRNT